MPSNVRDYTLRDVKISEIDTGHRLRLPTDDAITKIAKSINEIGLRSPITVRHNGDRIELCAGFTRLKAAESLGWESISCCFQDFASAEEAELWEIDENLMRGELSPAEEASHLARRKELFIIMNSGTSCPENRDRGRPAEFASDTANKTGESKRDINRKIARAAMLGDDINDVAGTSLDKGTELDALAKMDPPKRKEIIERARSGAPVSAVREMKSEHDVILQQYNALMNAWNRAGKEARQRFLESVDEPVFDAA